MTIGKGMSSRLDRVIRIERRAAGTDSYGVETQSWEELTTVPASYRPVPGTEKFANAAQGATAAVIFQIRYSPQVSNVSPKDRIAYAGRIYDIKSVTEFGRREGLDIVAIADAD